MRTLPPMPSDPSVCRWCGCRRVRLSIGVWHCPSGCAANDVAPYSGSCDDCGCQFETGKRFAAHQCPGCAAGQLAAQRADPGGVHGYDADMLKQGASREAWKLLPEAERERLIQDVRDVLKETS